MALRPRLRGEIATTRNNIIYPTYSSGRVDPRDYTLVEKGGGGFLSYDIYEDIARDPHAFAVLQKRLMAVVSRDWEIKPASEKRQDKKVAEFVTEALQQLGSRTTSRNNNETCINTGGNFDQVCFELLAAVLYGFSVSEILWEQRDGKIVPEHVIAKDIRRFIFTVADRGGYNLRLITWDNSHDGMPLSRGKFIVHRYNALGLHDDPYGLGLGSRLFFPRWFKSNAVKSWLIFADKLGMPTAVGKYPRTASTEERDTLLEALNAIATDSGIAIPEALQVEFLEAQRSSSVATYEGLVEFCNSEISKVVLGETGSTDQQGSGGSRARDQVGNEIRIEIAKGDADLLSSTLNNTLITWLVEYNFPRGTKVPSLVRLFPELEEKEDLSARAQRDATIVTMSERKLTEKYLVETYGVEFEEEKPDGLESLFGGDTAAAGETTDAPAEEPAPEAEAEEAVEPAPEETPVEEEPQPTAIDLSELEAAQAALTALQQGVDVEMVGDAPEPVEEPPDEPVADLPSEFDEAELADALTILTQMQAGNIANFDAVELTEPDLDMDRASEVLAKMQSGDIANFDVVELTEPELSFEERLEQYLEFTDFSEALDFAAAKKARNKPNCNPAKSHHCVGKSGGPGSCVSLTKECKNKLSGTAKAAADHIAANPMISRKSAAPPDIRAEFDALRRKSGGYSKAAEKKMSKLAAEFYKNPDDPEVRAKVFAAQEKFLAARAAFEEKALPIVKDFIQKASTDRAFNYQKHSMPGSEAFKAFQFEGVTYHYNDKSIEGTQRLIVELATRGKLPELLTSKTRDVYVSSLGHKDEAFWAERYNIPIEQASIAATGGGGSVVFYNGARGKRLRGTLSHEMGHNLAINKYGSTSPPPNSDFGKAAVKHPPPTDYAAKGVNEDFAESIRLFNVDPGMLKADAPDRYNVIKKLMEDESYAG
jgi:phage gp29-like protein